MVRNRKNYVEITTFFNFKQGTTRVGNSDVAKCNITSKNIQMLNISHLISKAGNLKIIPYPIIYNPDFSYLLQKSFSSIHPYSKSRKC